MLLAVGIIIMLSQSENQGQETTYKTDNAISIDFKVKVYKYSTGFHSLDAEIFSITFIYQLQYI